MKVYKKEIVYKYLHTSWFKKNLSVTALPAEDFEVGEKQACSYLEDSMSEQHHEERQSLQVINMKEFEEELKGDNSKLTTLLADRGKCARALYDYQAGEKQTFS